MFEGSTTWRARYERTAGTADDDFIRGWGQADNTFDDDNDQWQRVVPEDTQTYFSEPIMLLNPKVVDPRNKLKMPAIVICEESCENGFPLENWMQPLGADDLEMLAVPEHECGLTEEEEMQIAIDQEQWDREEEERRRVELRRLKAARRKRTKTTSTRSHSPPTSPAASLPSPRKKPKRKSSIPTALQEPKKMMPSQQSPPPPVIDESCLIPKTVAELTTPRRETTALPSHPLLSNSLSSSPTISPSVSVDPIPYLSMPKRGGSEVKYGVGKSMHLTSSPPNTTVSKPVHREVVRMQPPPHSLMFAPQVDVSRAPPVRLARVPVPLPLPLPPVEICFSQYAISVVAAAVSARRACVAHAAGVDASVLAVLASCVAASFGKEHLITIRRCKIELKQNLVQKRLMEGRETSGRGRIEATEEDDRKTLKQNERTTREARALQHEAEQRRLAEAKRLEEQHAREEIQREIEERQRVLAEEEKARQEEAVEREREIERKRLAELERQRETAAELSDEALDPEPELTIPTPCPQVKVPFKPSLFEVPKGFSLTFSGMKLSSPTPDLTRPPRLTTMDKLTSLLLEDDSETESMCSGTMTANDDDDDDDEEEEALVTWRNTPFGETPVAEVEEIVTEENVVAVPSPSLADFVSSPEPVPVSAESVTDVEGAELPSLPSTTVTPTSSPTTSVSTDNILLKSPLLSKNKGKGSQVQPALDSVKPARRPHSIQPKIGKDKASCGCGTGCLVM
eukprot:TRINITY_DN4895_c0_g1_i1.p1 TRINITY_DN4895_c0_g1~~TRINITY_DN4895_c0_g1_i1.p1  ORF type:complete len:741 (+),score=161.52 TRINITY_DN4895_c0_g1_i1:94-2316(+)